MTRGRIAILAAFAGITIFRLALASGQTLAAFGHAAHDDALYLRAAQHILSGRWLGPFDNLTLVKGPFYPLWIALTFVAGVPLQLSKNLLCVAACLVTVVALRPVIPKAPILLAIYTLLLFNPVTFSHSVTRVIREGVYVPLTLFLVACLIGVFLRRRSSLRSLAFWALGAGGALSALWLTREEGPWLIPVTVFMLAAASAVSLRGRIDRPWRRCLVLVSPLVMLGVATTAVSTVNWLTYGVYVTTDVGNADWLAGYGALHRVEHDRWQHYVTVPRNVREKIYQVSPAFAELRPAIEGDMGRAWMTHGCAMMPHTCGDITAGWFMWLLRDAVAGAGYYRSAATAAGYYRRLAQEVNDACDSGALRCGPARATMMPPWRSEYGPFFVRAAVASAALVARFDGLSAATSPSYGSERLLAPFRVITRARLETSVDAMRLRLHGWGFSPTEDLFITVEDADRRETESYVRSHGSPDLFAHCTKTVDQNCDRVRNVRFTLLTPCLANCAIVIRARSTGRVLGTLPVNGPQRALSTPDLQLYIDTVTRDDADGFPRLAADSAKVKALTTILLFYRDLGPILAAILIIALVLGPIALAFGYRSALLIPLWGIAMAIAGRIGLIALIHATSFPCIDSTYLGSANSLVLLGGLLGAVELAGVLRAGWTRLDAERHTPVMANGTDAGHGRTGQP